MANYFDTYTLDSLLDEMEAVYLNDKRPWILGYSGGKDSSATLQVTFKMLERLPKEKRHKPVYVVSSDTLIENPIILDYLKNNIDKINECAKPENLDLPIIAQIVYPELNDSFWANIIGKGYPTPKSIQYRWCTERLKIKPSNKFIKEKLEQEDVVVLLGVRRDESSARKARIEKREIEGYLLTPHETLRGKNKLAYVYTPIVNFSTADVWDVLYHNNDNLVEFIEGDFPTPATAWGTSAMELFEMYMKGSGDSGECPFIADESSAKSSCGNSRFGCWICTVVKEDKSLNGFIESGHTELKPLVEFRSFILSERDKPENRKKHKRNGSVVKRDGRIMFGPFTFEARQMILRKLLETQLQMQEFYPDLELINLGELKAIDEIWDNEEDLTSSTLSNIYKEVLGKELPWAEYKKPVFDSKTLNIIDEKCSEYNINSDLFSKLIIDTNKYKHFSNNTRLKTSVNKILNQQWLHQDIVQKIEDENIKELD
ncbi:DNA phosphorothioation system sulfurtransferase DndC [Romboutsia sedimentorum]|uniref:DNA phosphorothioation system sulfurtransferase DndC n=1 Tax=Romboutsia sedimentorum TaxID=1368474 RepID=A0ABT7E5K7_9FIRM|nr:DNA phosphorothioation system sulfurtransferase DndC [Romboutsia sedimentorum]MDK2562213.1 DNA phosphorothioation system sulfurtransferase DndC [Romboutsia sedimentorum]